MSKSVLSKLLMFTSGAIIGSVVTRMLLKEKYELRLKEELDKEYEYIRKDKENSEKKYQEILDEYSYDNTEAEETVEMKKPYVISPEEVEDSDYNLETLTYYSDGVLTDDYDMVIENPENIVGTDFMNHFGEYENDTVYVRNDEKELDYEILRDLKPYSEYMS